MENSPVRTCVVGPLFVSLSFSICTGLSNGMPPSHWLLAPRMRQDAEQRPRDDRWCYTTATVFVSERGRGGALPDIHWWIWLRKSTSVLWDEAIRGRREAGRQGKGMISANVSGSQVKVIICGILIYLNVCFAVISSWKIQKEIGHESFHNCRAVCRRHSWEEGRKWFNGGVGRLEQIW